MKRIGNAWGTLNRGKTYAAFALCAMTAIALSAQTFTTLHAFEGKDDGAVPLAGLVQATNGDFYGTTMYGGANNDGTVFKITPSGTLTMLYSFCAQSGCPDGWQPSAGLVQAASGDFYGTTGNGGVNGTVFKITPSGTLTTLYSFCAQIACTDGSYPWAGLVQATNGDFYGTTNQGGLFTNYYCSPGCGTIFKIDPSGTLTTLYSFCSQSGCTDGIGPYAGLVQATNGDFYGTTVFGGANPGPFGNGYGTVFKITSSGQLTTLHSFCSKTNCTDGEGPYGGLIQATNGDFYGTTSAGGANCIHTNGCGTVFRITPSGTLTTLYSFCSQTNCTDGGYPYAALVQATDGNLYGTTAAGGSNGSYGTIFKITPSGTLTTLYSFCPQSGCTDGVLPYAGLIQATNGEFYGTTEDRGASRCRAARGVTGCGTVFSLSVGLGPFVKTQPHAGNLGAAINILGGDLTGTTSVSFNGTAATFTVASPTLITTTVPVGATSGKIQVTTPGGTLFSGGPFLVLP